MFKIAFTRAKCSRQGIPTYRQSTERKNKFHSPHPKPRQPSSERHSLFQWEKSSMTSHPSKPMLTLWLWVPISPCMSSGLALNLLAITQLLKVPGSWMFPANTIMAWFPFVFQKTQDLGQSDRTVDRPCMWLPRFQSLVPQWLPESARSVPWVLPCIVPRQTNEVIKK